jgi:hypothetical protein
MFGRPSDNQKGRPPRPFRIHQARHGHVEGIGIGEKDSLRHTGTSCLDRRIASPGIPCKGEGSDHFQAPDVCCQGLSKRTGSSMFAKMFVESLRKYRPGKVRSTSRRNTGRVLYSRLLLDNAQRWARQPPGRCTTASGGLASHRRLGQGGDRKTWLEFGPFRTAVATPSERENSQSEESASIDAIVGLARPRALDPRFQS